MLSNSLLRIRKMGASLDPGGVLPGTEGETPAVEPDDTIVGIVHARSGAVGAPVAHPKILFAIYARDGLGNLLAFENIPFPNNNIVIHGYDSSAELDLSGYEAGTVYDTYSHATDYGGLEGAVSYQLLRVGSELVSFTRYIITDIAYPEGTAAEREALAAVNAAPEDYFDYAFFEISRPSTIDPYESLATGLMNKTSESDDGNGFYTRTFELDFTNAGFNGFPTSRMDILLSQDRYIPLGLTGSYTSILESVGPDVDWGTGAEVRLLASSAGFIEALQLRFTDQDNGGIGDVHWPDWDGEITVPSWPCDNPDNPDYENDGFNVQMNPQFEIYERVFIQE